MGGRVRQEVAHRGPCARRRVLHPDRERVGGRIPLQDGPLRRRHRLVGHVAVERLGTLLLKLKTKR